MLDVAPTELLMVAVVALVVIGPKDLPRAMRIVGRWVGRAQGVARHFRSGLDEMVRQAELEDMEKKWAAENERIMREHPAGAYTPSWDDHPPETTPAPQMQPLPAPAGETPVSAAAPGVEPQPEPPHGAEAAGNEPQLPFGDAPPREVRP